MDIKSSFEIIKPVLDKIFGDDWVLCGSAALVMSGVLNREINDLDIITTKDYYYVESGRGDFEYRVGLEHSRSANSGRFVGIDGYKITSFTIYPPELGGLKIDVFHHETTQELNIDTIEVGDSSIRIMNLEDVIRYKLQVLELNQLFDDNWSAKHLRDIKELSMNNKRMAEIVDLYYTGVIPPFMTDYGKRK